jgi:hypothetical protein
MVIVGFPLPITMVAPAVIGVFLEYVEIARPDDCRQTGRR